MRWPDIVLKFCFISIRMRSPSFCLDNVHTWIGPKSNLNEQLVHPSWMLTVDHWTNDSVVLNWVLSIQSHILHANKHWSIIAFFGSLLNLSYIRHVYRLFLLLLSCRLRLPLCVSVCVFVWAVLARRPLNRMLLTWMLGRATFSV